MAKRFPCIVIFFMFYDVMCTVWCEKDLYNLSSSQLSHELDLKNSDLPRDDMLENPMEESTIKKRRFNYSEGSNNSQLKFEKQSESNEFKERRKNSFSEYEKENETSDYQQKKVWEYEHKYPFPVKPGNFQNPAEFRSSQSFTDQIRSNKKYSDEMGDFFEAKPSRWNEERNFKHISNSEDPRLNKNFYGRAPEVIDDQENIEYSEDKGNDFFDRKVSMNILNDMEKNFNHENFGAKHFPQSGHSSMKYYNRSPHSFWHPNFHKPEKEVVINFNTECPTLKHFNNKLVHKFIFAPNSPPHSQSEISNIHIPETALIAGHKIIPIYYV